MPDTRHDQITPGEIHRSLQRLEATLIGIQQSVASIPGVVIRVAAAEAAIDDLKNDMKSVRRDAAVVSGGIGMAAFLASYLPWHR